MIVFFIQVFFSLSSIQFSINLGAKANRKVISRKWHHIFGVVFCTEMWAIIVVLLTQDLPFFIIRLIIIIQSGVEKEYVLYFMLIKNLYLCLLEVHMILNIFYNEKLLISENHKKKDLQETQF